MWWMQNEPWLRPLRGQRRRLQSGFQNPGHDRKVTVMSPYDKGGGLAGAWYSLTTSLKGWFWFSCGGTPALVISSSSIHTDAFRVFIPITTIQGLGESTLKVDSRGITLDFK